MSELTNLHAHARARADWTPGDKRAACRERTSFGTPKPADHVNCGGTRCGCECHQPPERERAMWRAIADEIEAYLAPDDDDRQEALL